MALAKRTVRHERRTASESLRSRIYGLPKAIVCGLLGHQDPKMDHCTRRNPNGCAVS